MEIKPFLHKHFLLYVRTDFQRRRCAKCKGRIGNGVPHYKCEICEFWIHEDCAKRELPEKITHPLHPQHGHLHLSSHISESEIFKCDNCFYIARGFKYSCQCCSFNLDLLCAGSQWEWNKFKQITTSYVNFVHHHQLSLFMYRETTNAHGYYIVCWPYFFCSWCEEPLSGLSYGCFACKFFLHESCAFQIPKKLQHPFHPQPHHHLYLQFSNDVFNFTPYCKACKLSIADYPKCGGGYLNRHYCCYKCNFWLHFHCARLLPTLKNDCHEHDLTYVRIHYEHEHDIIKYNSCGQNCVHELCYRTCLRERGFYRCVQCNLNFHLKCASIPDKAKHKFHIHELFLSELFREDGSGEYYCDICEGERKSGNQVYCCYKCNYVAHIECVLNQNSTKKLMPSVVKEFEQGNPGVPSQLGDTIDSTIKIQIQHFNHSHPLTFNEVVEKDENPACLVCKLEINSAAYKCEECGDHYLHKTCAELSPEVFHSLHPQHPLHLLTRYPNNKSKLFICDECRDISDGFVYYCFECQFKLDVKCVVQIYLYNRRENGEKREKTNDIPFQS